MVSSRLSQISESATVSMSNKASELRKAGKKLYNFGIGEPDMTTPDNIIKLAFDDAMSGKTHYTPSAGIPELREKIALKMKTKNNVDVVSKNVLVTPTKFSINLALYTIIDPGDEVIIPSPYYVSYPDIVKINGGKPVFADCDDEYNIDVDNLKKVLTPRSRVILINNPVNPTGKVLSEKNIKETVDFALENNLYIISDEIYEDIIYKGKMFSPASIPEAFEKTVTVSGFSKSYAMTGWRVGYMVAPYEIIGAADKIQQQTLTCAPSISQYAALHALDDAESVKHIRETFQKRRDLIVSLLKETNLHFYEPDGAFYVFPGYESDVKSQDAAMNLLEQKNVIVTPGAPFGSEYHFRISFATSEDDINNGIPLIGEYFKSIS